MLDLHGQMSYIGVIFYTLTGINGPFHVNGTLAGNFGVFHSLLARAMPIAKIFFGEPVGTTIRTITISSIR
jgi:hypothetical protein